MFLFLSLFSLAPGVISNAKDTPVQKTDPKNDKTGNTRQNSAQGSTNAYLQIIPVSSDKGYFLNKIVSKLKMISNAKATPVEKAVPKNDKTDQARPTNDGNSYLIFVWNILSSNTEISDFALKPIDDRLNVASSDKGLVSVVKICT